ncbi:EI24 domain-containing protein [Altererythrobacter sp.]|nr:EI24 domain-containing protein [Altererythrobacter sp.]
MMTLTTSIARATGQLADPAILRVLVKSILATLAIFALLGAGLWLALDAVLESWIAAYTDDDYSDGIAAALTAVVALVGGWLLFRIVALAVIQFFADESCWRWSANTTPTLQ